VVEEGAVVEEEAVLEGQIFVGRDVHIGPQVWIAPQVVLYPRTTVGARTRIHSGTVLGADGFGVLLGDEGAREAIPHVGGVLIEEDVVLGAHVTVDRGTLDVTRVGAGTKVDDHVHVGHNADIGRRCVLVAYVGIAGSAVVEDGSILAARSGVAPHVRIGRGAQLAAMAGATRDVPPGGVVSGFPAWDHKKALRVESLMRRLPELFERLKRLEKGRSGESS
jgi:UDP-3-O-[3-hydroxymyristoyl] glucosamine N-acyltransferase